MGCYSNAPSAKLSNFYSGTAKSNGTRRERWSQFWGVFGPNLPVLTHFSTQTLFDFVKSKKWGEGLGGNLSSDKRNNFCAKSAKLDRTQRELLFRLFGVFAQNSPFLTHFSTVSPVDFVDQRFCLVGCYSNVSSAKLYGFYLKTAQSNGTRREKWAHFWSYFCVFLAKNSHFLTHFSAVTPVKFSKRKRSLGQVV